MSLESHSAAVGVVIRQRSKSR